MPRHALRKARRALLLTRRVTAACRTWACTLLMLACACVDLRASTCARRARRMWVRASIALTCARGPLDLDLRSMGMQGFQGCQGADPQRSRGLAIAKQRGCGKQSMHSHVDGVDVRSRDPLVLDVRSHGMQGLKCSQCSGSSRDSAPVRALWLNIAEGHDINMVRRRFVGRCGVHVLRIQDQTRTGVEV